MIHQITGSLTYALTRSLSHFLSQSASHSVTRSLTQWISTYLPPHSVTHSLSHSLIHSLLQPSSLSQSLTHALTHSLTHSFTHSLRLSLSYSLTHWFTHAKCSWQLLSPWLTWPWGPVFPSIPLLSCTCAVPIIMLWRAIPSPIYAGSRTCTWIIVATMCPLTFLFPFCAWFILVTPIFLAHAYTQVSTYAYSYLRMFVSLGVLPFVRLRICIGVLVISVTVAIMYINSITWPH